MIKKSLILLKISLLLVISLSFLINTPVVSAMQLGAGERCGPNSPSPGIPCIDNYDCSFDQASGYDLCLPSPFSSTFGKIQPPDALAGFLKKDPTGAGALSQFFSNFVALIFSVAGIVLILMILWGAFDWMISEGDKEKVAAARNKIINAVIGIILFALAFAIIQVLGQFTGFKFFKGQGISVERDTTNSRYFYITCRDGNRITVITEFGTLGDPDEECRKRGHE